MSKLIVTFGLALVGPALSAHVCGNYCGSTWCNAGANPECTQVTNGGSSCVQNPGNCRATAPTDGSCADACCREHDLCCGSTDRRPCNRQIVACLDRCSRISGPWCVRNFVGVPIATIRTAMAIVASNCCGGSCTNARDATFAQLEGNETHAESYASDESEAAPERTGPTLAQLRSHDLLKDDGDAAEDLVEPTSGGGRRAETDSLAAVLAAVKDDFPAGESASAVHRHEQ